VARECQPARARPDQRQLSRQAGKCTLAWKCPGLVHGSAMVPVLLLLHRFLTLPLCLFPWFPCKGLPQARCLPAHTALSSRGSHVCFHYVYAHHVRAAICTVKSVPFSSALLSIVRKDADFQSHLGNWRVEALIFPSIHHASAGVCLLAVCVSI